MVLLRRTRHFASIVTLAVTLGCAFSSNANQREPNNPQEQAARSQNPSAAPAVNPPAGTQGEPGANGQHQPANNWREFLFERVIDPVTWFTFGLLVLGGLQYLAMRRQADYMRDGLDETRASIAEATRSAKAMEDIAGSMATSVQSVKDSLTISKQIANSQMLAIVLQNRAYLEVIEWRVFALVNAPHVGGALARPAYVRYFIKNKGQTAATLHTVIEAIPTAEISRTIAPDLILEPGNWVELGIPFKIPASEADEEYLLVEPFRVNLEITYSDGFATRTKRFGRHTGDHIWALRTASTGEEKAPPQQWLVCGGTEWNREIEHPSEAESEQRQPEDQP